MIQKDKNRTEQYIVHVERLNCESILFSVTQKTDKLNNVYEIRLKILISGL